MNPLDDHFLEALYEAPRPEFADALWDDLVRQAVTVTDSRPITKEDPVLTLTQTIHPRGGLRRSWALTGLAVVLAVALALILTAPLSHDDHQIHYASLGAPITPTVSPEQPATIVPGEQSVNAALANADQALPAVALDLGIQTDPTEFTLDNETPAVRLRLDGQPRWTIPITLELDGYVPQPGIAIRISRNGGSELQPLLVYKPEQLVSLPLEFPIATVDRDGKADVIVELLTPLTGGNKIALRAYQGGFYTLLAAVPSKVSCEGYLTYCVPLNGGGTGDYLSFEAAYVRTLDRPSSGLTGVVRGLSADGAPAIGNPLAPAHVAIFMDFACPHCATFYLDDLKRLIETYALTNQAQIELYFTTRVGGPVSELASQAALAAGEQGAFWEMTDALFTSAQTDADPFTLEAMRTVAQNLGLTDIDQWQAAVTSGSYQALLDRYQTLMNDLGIGAVPTIAVRTPSGAWQVLPDNRYETVAAWIMQAARNSANQGDTLPVSIPLDPVKNIRVGYGLNAGDQIVLHFNLEGITAETRETSKLGDEDRLTFEGMVILPSGTFVAREGVMVLVVAVQEENAGLIARLVGAEVPVTIGYTGSE